ncbi:cellulose synthase (UDP-forming) [Variovorax sp. HW608]|uniref:efflux transporter outer membrane subunit n=1 Tax=Variovorax sp. HW608 TaxID=1034889 RepID=UPI00081FE3AC|nr:efflux transporter outer membrane subunit [Variovorax sp. HW608]SCK27089.1 cellulose synthase (UDP-forming) [Variovorax sp. HW608]
MSDVIDMPEFSINLVVATMALIMIFWARPERLSHRMVFGGLTALVIARYVAWRVTETLPPAGEGLISLYAWVFLFFEMVSVVCTLMSIQILMGRRDNSAMADRGEARLRGLGVQVPAVDVFICTYNEDLGVLEKTIIGAQAIDYPNVNVWVLDDTRRDWLRDYCASRGVNYARRPDNTHAKAGNLNNGLRVSAETTNAPYLLVLDADFVPHRNIVYRVLGLFDEPKVGLVQTPQFYYNADPIQHNLHATDSWVDEQRVFFDVLQPAKDAADAAFCVGTSFIVRRDVITRLGGFPTGSVCEDIFTSLTLLRHGWVTRWLNERLSNGLSADSIIEYINQRSRWCLGTIQVALLPDGPLRGKGYSLTARMHFVHGLLHWLSKPFMLLMLAAPVMYWFFGVSAFYATPRAFAAYGLPALIVFWAYSYWINQRRSLPVFTEVTQVVAAMAVTRTIASALIRPFGRPFKVTAKGLDRSKTVVHWNLVAVFGGLMVAIELGAFRALSGPMTTGDTLNMIWSVAGTIYCLAALVACVDRPRPDQEERFPFAALTRFRSSAGVGAARFVNIATDGALLRDSALLQRLPAGHDVDVHVPDVGWISARVDRHTRSGAELLFDCDASLHDRLVRQVFAMPPTHVATQARAGRAALAFMNTAGWRWPRWSQGPLRRLGVSIAQPLIALAGLLMLSGCNLTPPLKPADVQVPAQWPVAATTTAAAPIAWSDFVVDDELRGLITTALAQNRDLRAYAARARQARAAYAGTRSSLFPEIGVTAFAERSNVTTALGPSGLVTANQPGGHAGNTFGVQAGITSYELDFFGRVGSTVQQAGSQAQSSDLDYAAARINLVGEVCNAYLTLRADRALLALSEAEEKSQTDSTKVMTRARTAGGASEQDVFRSQSLVQRAQVQHEEFQTRVGQDLQWLTVLVGQPVSPTTGSQRAWPGRSVAEIPAGLPSSLLQHRPDLLAAYARVEAANAGIGAAKAEFFPTISLTALGGGISTGFSHVLSSGNRSWAGLLGVSLPILDWGKRSANVDANEARLAEAMATYEHAAQQAFRETADALIADSHLRPQLEAEQARVQSLAKVASISQVRFKGGLEDYFSSLDSQRELYNEQIQWIELQLRQAVNTVNLYKALGGGWSENGAKKTSSG